MSVPFYTRGVQIRRELRTVWRTRPDLGILLGIVYLLLAFYVLQRPGASQVYPVLAPYLMTSLHLAVMILVQGRMERGRRAIGWQVNLPRDRGAVFDARVVFFLGLAVIYEMVIGLGVGLKLGGGGVTPFYRLHPEFVVLPFCTVFLSLSHVYRSSTRTQQILTVSIGLIAITWLACRILMLPAPMPSNNYLPPRQLGLWVEFGVALVLFVVTAALAWQTRQTWRTSDWSAT